MIRLDIRSDVARVAARESPQLRKQVDFAAMRAVNALAFEVQRAEAVALKTVFRSPRPFTQRAVQVDKATKSTLTARVFVRSEAAKYLLPYEVGGRHAIPGKGIGLVVPKNLRLDRFGQIRGRPSAIPARPGVFVATITFRASGETISGMWQRPAYGTRRTGEKGTKGALGMVGGAKTGLILLARFEDALPVTKRFGFKPRATALVKLRAQAVMKAELARALVTARR